MNAVYPFQKSPRCSATSKAGAGAAKGFMPKCRMGHWKTTTFVAALRHDGITAPFVLDGPINGECFLAYVETVLVPTLSLGDIVLIDNLASHNRKSGKRSRPRAPNCVSCRATRPT